MTINSAVSFLRKRGAVIKSTATHCAHGRLYYLYDPHTKFPPMWLSSKALVGMAELEIMFETSRC